MKASTYFGIFLLVDRRDVFVDHGEHLEARSVVLHLNQDEAGQDLFEVADLLALELLRDRRDLFEDSRDLHVRQNHFVLVLEAASEVEVLSLGQLAIAKRNLTLNFVLRAATNLLILAQILQDFLVDSLDLHRLVVGEEGHAIRDILQSFFG